MSYHPSGKSCTLTSYGNNRAWRPTVIFASDEGPRDPVIALLADKTREVDGRLAAVFLGDDRQGVAETIAALKPGDVLVAAARRDPRPVATRLSRQRSMSC